MADRLLVITGPTASGKSDVALEVARRLGGEVVSMDSRQVYRGMDIGTAKPDRATRQAVPHHGLDLIDPDQRYSAGQFARDAHGWFAGIHRRGRVPILAGGTGFFLRALTTPLFGEPVLDCERRERLKHWLAGVPLPQLRDWAVRLDDAALTAASDPQRLARRIEVALLTGRPLSWWHRHGAAGPALLPLVFVLELPRAELYRRIDARVRSMIARGLVGEVQALLGRGYDQHDPGMNAVGYIELLPHLRGERTLDEAIELIQSATHRYARRQLTWFRNQLPAGHSRLDASAPVAVLAERIMAEWGRVEA